MSRDGASALFWLILAVLVVVQSFALRLGTLRSPGPGFFPFWGAVVLAVLCIILLVASAPAAARARARHPTATPSRTTRAQLGAFTAHGPVIVVLTALLGYMLLLPMLGFATVTFLFLLVLFRLVRKGWTVSGLAALAGAAASYALFQVWLGTQLPRGPFGF